MDEAEECLTKRLEGRGAWTKQSFKADIDLLEPKARRLRKVNKEIAHKNRGGMQGDKATGEILEKCISNLIQLRASIRFFCMESLSIFKTPILVRC